MAWEVSWLETTDSTMREAARLAQAGCPHGTVIAAGEQTAGRGRLGRSWHSEKGAGLYVSAVLRLNIEMPSLPPVSLALGLAAAEAIFAVSGVSCDLRWPNDVLADGKKCAGILVQLDEQAVLAGIGINVNHTAFPQDLAPTATSLRLVSGREHSLKEVLRHLLASMDRYLEILEETGADPVLDLFTQASSYVRGRRVLVDQEGSVLRGVTEGLTAAGFLKLREDSGKQTIIVAGGVRPG